jgi:hypothetical protein
MKEGEKPTEISFNDFVILFANHKTFSVSDDDVIRAFERLGMLNDDDDIFIGREEFVHSLTTKGGPECL